MGMVPGDGDGDGERASAASLIVEAFGDAVPPPIFNAIGRAITRAEAALDPVFGRTSLAVPGDER